MEKLLSGDDPILRVLMAQCRTVTVTRREFTGVGFYTDLSISPEAPRLPADKKTQLTDVTAETDGLQYGAGFVLFVKEGKIQLLEGFTYGEPWPENPQSWQLSYMGKQERDLEAIRKKLE